MVLKRSKGNVNSGNTLKGCHPRHTRHYRNESAIIKYTINCDQSANSDEIFQNGITYSLNKKNRWKMVKALKNEIHQRDADEEFSISLAHYHKLCKVSNCTMYMSSKWEANTVLPKHGATYLNAKSLTPKVVLYGKTEMRTQRIVTPRGVDYERVPAEPEVRYEVYEPGPSNSAITHHQNASNHLNYSWSKKHNSRNKRVPYEDIDIDYYDDFSDSDEESGDDVGCHRNNKSWDDYLNLNHTRNVEVLKYTAPPKRLDTKAKVVFVDRESSKSSVQTPEESTQLSASPVSIETNNSIPRQVGVTAETLTPDFLQTIFGDRYYEAGCVPRRFFINISEDVIAFMKEEKLTPRTDLEAYVCFSCSDDWLAQGVELVGVSLVSNVCSSSVSVETLCEFEMYTTLDVIESVMKYISILPEDSFNCKQNTFKAVGSTMYKNYDLVNSSFDWSVSCQVPETIYKEAALSHVKNSVQGYCVPMLDGQVCSICYSNPITAANSTALSSCLHWYCNECWQHYLVGKIKSRDTRLTCPESSCKSVVDYLTLMTLVSHRLANLHIHHQVELKHMSEWKWCPNQKCGRVVVSKGVQSGPINVDCVCGLAFCYNCLKLAHWPATCEQADHYLKRLKDKGDDNKIILSLTVNTCNAKVKFCPKCGHGMMKNGGCSQMMCLCGHHFCWLCVKQHAGYDCQGAATVPLQTLKFDNEFVSDLLKTSSTYYKWAVVHRRSQHPIALRKLRLKANEIGQNLKPNDALQVISEPSASILKLSNMSVGVFTMEEVLQGDFVLLPARPETGLERDCKKTIHDRKQLYAFLHRTLGFYCQIRHVAEHLSILIESRLSAGTPSGPQVCLQRLEFVCTAIEEIFSVGKHQDMKAVVPRLQKLVNAGADCLLELCLYLKTTRKC